MLVAAVMAVGSVSLPQEPPKGTTLLSPGAAQVALDFSPLGAPLPDPTNAVYENERAARLGQAIFYDTRFSANGGVSCSTCHDPAKGFSDARRLARGIANLPRHTMTLWNAAYNRWFFWDGRKDTLWSQALAPLEDPREHGSNRLFIAHLVASDPKYSLAYEETFGAAPGPLDPERFPPNGRPVPGEDGNAWSVAWSSMREEDREHVNRVFVNVGKALAAYERRLVSANAPFDTFVEGLRTGDGEKLRALSPAAQRGFELFQGKARCFICHDGPNFTDMEFHTNRAPTEEGTDPGRSIGIRKLREDPFNTLSSYADDGGEVGRVKVASLRRHEHPTQEFKTPTLRNVARTAPYMHEGQFATLEEVVEFYSTLEGAAPLSSFSERVIQPLGLNDEEKRDLVDFLRSLTDESLDPRWLGPPETP